MKKMLTAKIGDYVRFKEDGKDKWGRIYSEGWTQNSNSGPTKVFFIVIGPTKSITISYNEVLEVFIPKVKVNFT